jgi:hypothetical protein
MRKKYLAFITGLIFIAAGFFVPFWPFLVLGILMSALMYPLIGIVFGIAADLFFGAPAGTWQFIHVPFSLLGVAAGLLSVFASSRLRSRSLY